MISITYILGIAKNKGNKYGHCHSWNIEMFDLFLSKTKFKVIYKELFNSLASRDLFFDLFTWIFPRFKTEMLYVMEKK